MGVFDPGVNRDLLSRIAFGISYSMNAGEYKANYKPFVEITNDSTHLYVEILGVPVSLYLQGVIFSSIAELVTNIEYSL